MQLLLFLDNQREVELLAGARGLDLRRVLQEPAQQRLHLHE